MVMVLGSQYMCSAQFKRNLRPVCIACFIAFVWVLTMNSMAVTWAETSPDVEALPSLVPSAVLDATGGRSDKNSVGSGRNVALYVGQPSKFFFATHALGDVFN